MAEPETPEQIRAELDATIAARAQAEADDNELVNNQARINEIAKLKATAMDRLSTAFFTVGVLAPVLQQMLVPGATRSIEPWIALAVCLILTWGLHLGARNVLEVEFKP
jgi:hypothetical protein